MATNVLFKENKHYTYADYCSWQTNERYELINGVPYLMSAPEVAHQQVVRELLTEFNLYLRGKQCEVFDSPIDVRLNADGADDIVVQPDLLVVCDRSKIETNCVKGAPDLVIEVISPSTRAYDTNIKLKHYFDFGVREYWVVEISTACVMVYLKDENGTINFRMYGKQESVPVSILPELTIPLARIFPG